MNLLNKYLLNISYGEGTPGESPHFSPPTTPNKGLTWSSFPEGSLYKLFHKLPRRDVLSQPAPHTSDFGGQKGPFLLGVSQLAGIAERLRN